MVSRRLKRRYPVQMMSKESDLYPPIKALLTRMGYTVKGEVGAADVMGVGADDEIIVVELKMRFALGLFHQAITRLRLTDLVYIAVPRPTGKSAKRAIKDNTALCRRLGLGLIFVLQDGRVEVQCDPGPYAPRHAKAKKAKLLREFHRLRGDPNAGGATRHGIVTAYRQDAVRCAAYLATSGAEKGAIIAKATGVKAATSLMRNNHYGWFEKVEKGVYDLTPEGRKGLADWSDSENES